MQEETAHTAQTPAAPQEERRYRRLKVLKRAMIAFGGGQFSGFPCVIRDMTIAGARLELSDTIALPRFFTLHVEIDGFKVECELVWQGLTYAGVRFIGEKQATPMARKQVLQTSETALSEQFLRDEAERRRREQGHHGAQSGTTHCNGEPAPAATPLRRQVSFGKRKFEG